MWWPGGVGEGQCERKRGGGERDGMNFRVLVEEDALSGRELHLFFSRPTDTHLVEMVGVSTSNKHGQREREALQLGKEAE